MSMLSWLSIALSLTRLRCMRAHRPIIPFLIPGDTLSHLQHVSPKLRYHSRERRPRTSSHTSQSPSTTPKSAMPQLTTGVSQSNSASTATLPSADTRPKPTSPAASARRPDHTLSAPTAPPCADHDAYDEREERNSYAHYLASSCYIEVSPRCGSRWACLSRRRWSMSAL